MAPARCARGVDPAGDADLARIRRAMAQPEEVRGPLPPDASAVLLPLLVRPEGLAVLFIRRTEGMTRHAGQMAFPGGRIEPEDKTPAAAALREAEEEVGLPAGEVEVLGHLSDYTTYYGRLVCCYVGLVGPGAPAPRIAAPGEVAAVLELPLRGFLDAAIYEGRRMDGDPRREGVVHYWHFPGVKPAVWGITAELMARFLRRTWDWRPPREPRAIATVEDFRTGL